MTSLFTQLQTLSGPSNKALTRFRREYASREHFNRTVVAECWDHMLGLDASYLECQCLFRRCLFQPGVAAVASLAARSSDADGPSTATAPVSEWEEKEVEFMHESEVAELERVLQVFLDLSVPWLLHEQCQRLIDFLIYHYELASRFGDMLLLALLPIHDSPYYRKVSLLVTLPDGSDLWQYVPAKNADSKVKSPDSADSQGVSRELVVCGTVRSFSNYKRISETVERIVLSHNRGQTYVPLYTVLTLAFIEQNGKKLGDDEIRLLLNNAFTGLKHPQHSAYYSAQLCVLSVLFATVPVTIPVQRSVVTSLLNPLLGSILESPSPSFEMRLQLKDSVLVLLGMLHQQKERLEVLQPTTTRLLLRVFHQFPQLVGMFRGLGSSGDVLDFSRLCKFLTLSVVKVLKQRFGRSSSEEPDVGSPDLISCVVELFVRLDFSICYVRVMLYTLIDDLVMFSLSCQNGEKLFEWDSTSMTGSPNASHRKTLSVYGMFVQKLYSSSPVIFEDVLRRALDSPNRPPEVLQVFLLICHSVSGGCALRFTFLVHKCLGRRVDSAKLVLPKSVSADNLGSTLLLYTDPNLPSACRSELYKMLSSVLRGDALSSVDYGLLREFVRVSISDNECSPHFLSDTALLSEIPVSIVSDVVTKHIGSLITGRALKFSASVGSKDGFDVIDMSDFYGKCFEALSGDSAASHQLLCALGLFCKFYARADGMERASMHSASHHFMSFLQVICNSHTPPKKAANRGNSKKSSDSGVSGKRGDRKIPPGPAASDLTAKRKPDEPGNTAKDTSPIVSLQDAPTISAVCATYFDNSNSCASSAYESTMSLLMSILEFMVRISTAATYVSTSSAGDTEASSSMHAYVAGDNCTWCNEWLVCYGLFRSSELLQASTGFASEASASGSAKSPAGRARGATLCQDTSSSMVGGVLSSDQSRQLFALSEVVLGYAIKMCRESVLLGDLAYGFARFHLRFATLYTLSAAFANVGANNAVVDSAPHGTVDKMLTSRLHVDSDVGLDRDILMLHAMLSLSSDEMVSDFKESVSKAPKSVLSHMSLWLKHYFEFGRLLRSSTRRTASRLDLYSKFGESYVDVTVSGFMVTTCNVVSESLESCLDQISAVLKCTVDLPNVPLPEAVPSDSRCDTLRIPFNYFLDLDTSMEMYGRCMGILSHLVGEVMCLKVFNSSCFLLDVMVNSFEFVLDKELSIRRPAVSMLCSAMKHYVKVPGKGKGHFVSVCGYRLSVGYTEATSTVEHSFKGLDKAMKQVCSTLIEKDSSSANTMFASELFAQCSRDPVVSSALLYAYVCSGTCLQFDIETLWAIIGASPCVRSMDIFGTSLVGILSRIEGYSISTASSLCDLIRFLLCFASLESSITAARFLGSDVYFASTLCPAIFQSVSLLFNRVSDVDASLQGHVRAVRSLVSLCAIIGTSALSGGLFWTLKGDVQNRFMESFDSVFWILDGGCRYQCLRFITSGYDSAANGMKPLVSTIERLYDRSCNFMEQFLMGVLSQASPELLFDAFNAILHHDKSSKHGMQVSCLLLQRLVISVDLSSTEGVSMLAKGCTSLFDRVAKLCKSADSSGARETSDSSPMSHLSHLSNFITVLYRRLYRTLGTTGHKGLYNVHGGVFRCLTSLSQLYGSCVYDFVRPFLCCMCVVGSHLSSLALSDSESVNDEFPVSKETGSPKFGSICDVLMHVMESEKSSSTCLQFVNLAVLFTDVKPVKDMLEGVPIAVENGNSHSQMTDLSDVYDEWLCYSLYGCLWVGRLDRSSPAVLRCVELLKSSGDIVGVLAKLLFTILASTCASDSEYLRDVPRLDVGTTGLGKHLDSSSRLELVHEVYAFIKEFMDSNADLFEVDINAESFNNFKSLEYRRYRSVSLLLQGITLSLVCFKNVPSEDALSSLSKRKRGLMAMGCGMGGTFDDCGRMILRNAKEMGRLIYNSNPAENYPRLALGGLSFFGKIERCLSAGNYWTDGCELQITQQPWICEYIVSALTFIATVFGNKVSLSDRHGQPVVSGTSAAFFKEFSTVLGNLTQVLSDFLLATDSYVSGKKVDKGTEELFMRGRKTVWRCIIGLCGRLYGPWASPCFSLASSRLDLMLHQKSPPQPLLLDFVNSVKMCIRVLCTVDGDLGSIDLNPVRALSSSLSKFTAHVVQNGLENPNLLLCVVVLMLILRCSFGSVTGDDLLEAILNILLFYSSSDVHEERFPLPAADKVLADNDLVVLCREIYEELLGCKSDKLCTGLLKGSESLNLVKATCPRVLTLLSFYASLSCKYQNLLKLVLGLDFSQVLSSIRNSSRLLSLLAINLYYNRIKSKHAPDLERIYFLNVKLMSDFESGLPVGNPKSRSASKGKTSNPKDDDCAEMGAVYLDSPIACRLDLSCRLFSEAPLEFEDARGVKSFEDCVIAFALQYFAKIKSGDLVEVFTNHLRCGQKAEDGVEGPPMDGTRLFLRVLMATLSEYGSLGATQFVLPRVYQFLNSVLASGISELCGESTAVLTPKRSAKCSVAAKSWKCFVNSVFTLRSLRVCVETWDSKESSVPEMFLNTILPTLGHALNVFDSLGDDWRISEWERALEDLFFHLLVSCSGDADRIESVLSGGVVSRSTVCKCRILSILLSLWGRASFHLGGTVVNVMPMVGELVEDESVEVQRLAGLLNDRIQSFMNAE
ncbi:hypothetical protein X943_000229 [Babesia divergens]|uniref:HEAT repeat-containing protein 1 n=1 Tax=Babesia divergens TaxID=32595 RepID=A0AAD9G8X0_BABDI|nr:hypothetical protein X943_000229 [Babesia divergens]